MKIIGDDISDYVRRNTGAPESIFDELEEETYRRCPNPGMQVGRVEGTFLRMLVRLMGARRVLELGTFTGYSALMMAAALPEDGVIYTLESNDKHASIAQKYFDRVPYGWKIKIILGDARESLSMIRPPMDMAFIDADKVSYDLYYEKVMELLRPGGLIAMDNMLQGGRVLDPEDESARIIDHLNGKIAEDVRVQNVLLTVRDGIMLVIKQ